MSKKTMNDLREMLCVELDAIAKKREISPADLTSAHTLTDTIKNILKIEMLEEDSGYSQDGGYSQNGYGRNGYSQRGYRDMMFSRGGEWEGEMRGSYGHGNSYTNRGKHYVRGHYSRDDGRSESEEAIERLMDEARNEDERHMLRKMLERVREA